MSAVREVIEETGGYRVGRSAWLAINASWPFGTLEIHRDRLVLHTMIRGYTFPHESIVRLSLFRGLFSRGLRIEHSIASYPQFIVFWSFRMSRVQQRLAEFGFQLVDTKRPNQAMQLTASKAGVYAWSVCRRERILRGMRRGLAAADLVAR